MSTGRVARRRQRRERRERIGGIVLVTLGVVVLVVAVLALVNRHGTNNTANRTVIVTGTPSRSNISTAPSPSRPTTSSSASSSTTAPASSSAGSSSSSAAASLPVVVLNNTRLTGLGARAASELQAQGYTVTSVANYRNNIVSTCAYYDPSTPGAQQAASALQSKFSWIARTKPKFDGLPAGPVVLVLTADIP